MEQLRQRRSGATDDLPPSLSHPLDSKKVSPTKKRDTAQFSNSRVLDIVVVSVFTVLAIGTRFYRLHFPAAVVFDELHFSKFIDRTIQQIWFFDIHPPLGKLILAYTSHLLGYRPEPTFIIEKIGHEYPTHVKYSIVRAVSAAFSVGTVPLTYVIARQLRISRISSALATMSVLLDFLGVIEGRLILMDSQLLFFCQLSLCFALHLWETHSGTRKRTIWLLLTGLACGTALSIKHTALATPGLIAIISFFGLHFLSQPLEIFECIYAGVCGLIVYVISFYIMFHALWYAGGKYDNFMPMHFKKTLIDGEFYDPEAKRVSFLRLFFYLNRRMIQSNAGIKKRHSWESDWYHWIFDWRGVLYYVKRETVDGVELKSQIYLLGNPVVIYLTMFAVIVFVAMLLLSIRYRKSWIVRVRSAQLAWKWNNGIFLLSGWLCNLLPYILVHRAAFIYHYIPGLFYGQLLAALVFDFLPAKARITMAVITMGAIVAAFVYWSPWVYCFPLTDEQHRARQWLPKWT